jgi:hypothetical protein
MLLRTDGGSESSRLLVRLALATGVAAWGGLTDRAWTVPLAAMLALPIIWMDSFSMLLGCVALSRHRSTRRTTLSQPSDSAPAVAPG